MLFVGLAKANMMPMQIPQPAVIIRANGAVDPATAPIQRDENVYTLTDDVVGYTIGFECDDVTVDGNGYSLLGNESKSTGVFILNKNGITIKNLNIRNSTYGIRVYSESYFGASASDNKLLNNTVTNCGSGIILSSSSNTLLRNNVMTNNTYNFGVQGIYTNDVDDSNLVDGRPIIYWVKQQNKTVPSNAGYVAIVNCTNVVVQGLSLVNNVQGVVLCYTEDSTVTKNTVTNTTDAVYIYGSTNNNVTENTLTFNGCGMKVYTASNNSISLNNITNNTDGIIATSASTGNTFSNQHRHPRKHRNQQHRERYTLF
jgi:parallel beta-helix repeat protein